MAYRAEVGIDRGDEHFDAGDLIEDPADWLIEQALVVEVDEVTDDATSDDTTDDVTPDTVEAAVTPKRDEN